jgi:hypothetical protein
MLDKYVTLEPLYPVIWMTNKKNPKTPNKANKTHRGRGCFKKEPGFSSTLSLDNSKY